MQIKPYILLILTLLCTSSCSTHPVHHLTGPEESRPDFFIADQLVHNISQKLSQEGIYIYTTGGAYYPTIKVITNGYATRNYQYTSPKEARILFCSIFDMYLASFNSETRIRPYLKDFPFTEKNIQLSLVFLDKDGKQLPSGYISEVSNQNGYIIYGTHNQNEEPILALKEHFGGAYEQYLQHKRDGFCE